MTEGTYEKYIYSSFFDDFFKPAEKFLCYVRSGSWRLMKLVVIIFRKIALPEKADQGPNSYGVKKYYIHAIYHKFTARINLIYLIKYYF